MSLVEASDQKRPALGHDVQLGALYDHTTSQIKTISLWKSEQINTCTAVDTPANNNNAQRFEFKLSYSLEESREQAQLDAQGRIELDLGLIQASGSGQYLSQKSKSKHEARVDVTCKIVSRTRRLPMETLSSPTYEEYLDNAQLSHFVGEVVEGASATLSFRRSCSSEDEVKKVIGQLKGKLKCVPVEISGSVEVNDTTSLLDENLQIEFCGNVVVDAPRNLDAALALAEKLPTLLKDKHNVLSYTLVPVSSIPGQAVRRLVRSLSNEILCRLRDALADGASTSRDLRLLQEQFKDTLTSVPQLYKQIEEFCQAYLLIEGSFLEYARGAVPKMKDGNVSSEEYSKNDQALISAINQFKILTRLSQLFIREKTNELSVLRGTIFDLISKHNFSSELSKESNSLVANDTPRFILSFGGKKLNHSRHPLLPLLQQSALNPLPANTLELLEDCSSDSDHDDDSDNDEKDPAHLVLREYMNTKSWHGDENSAKVVRNSCSQLRALRESNHNNATCKFYVGVVDKANLPGKNKPKSTKVGDVVLETSGSHLVVTDHLPQPPSNLSLIVNGTSSITVSWEQPSNEAFSVSAFYICYRRLPLDAQNGRSWRIDIDPNEPLKEKKISNPTLRSTVLENLDDGIEYQVYIVTEFTGDFGTLLSPRSQAQIVCTDRAPSAASSMIDFFFANKNTLEFVRRYCAADRYWEKEGKKKSWEFDSKAAHLFVGSLTKETVSVDFKDPTDPKAAAYKRLALVVVDVAPEYKPEILPAELDDCVILKFVGKSGHGKTTQINAFISMLLNADVDDAARLMFIDDRFAEQSKSVTSHVTLYRIRPLSPSFQGKTIVIVDTPGFGDTDGFKGNYWVTQSLSAFLHRVKHINMVLFCCKSDEQRDVDLKPVVEYVFRLFAKNIKPCLKTVVTHGTLLQPVCIKTLQQLKWPTDHFVVVKNEAFKVQKEQALDAAVLAQAWNDTMRGQSTILKNVLHSERIPTDPSAQVTTDRMNLEEKAAIASDTVSNFASSLDRLHDALEALPKIEVMVPDISKVPLPNGLHSMYCRVCEVSCYESCESKIDELMKNGRCTRCKGGCRRDDHFIFPFVLKTTYEKKLMVPKEFLERWCEDVKKLLVLIGTDQRLQDQLQYLSELTANLNDTALHHDPQAILQHFDRLILDAKAYKMLPSQVEALSNARRSMFLLQQMKSVNIVQEQNTLAKILKTFADEMKVARLETNMSQDDHELYTRLFEMLPLDIRWSGKLPQTLESSSERTHLPRAILRLAAFLLKRWIEP